MSAVPVKRLLVYVAVGVVVLAVGLAGLLCARADPGSGESGGEGVLVQTGDMAGDASGVAAGVVSTSTPTFTPTSTTEAPRIWVQVAGAVSMPGVYQLPAGSRVFEAVMRAGGFAEKADEQAVALAAQLSDGCRVYVPQVGEITAGAVVTPAQSSAGVTGGSTGSGAVVGPVYLNTATAQQLDALPGIGPSLAQQIIAYREAQGPFTSVDQLTDVPGIGPAKMEKLRPLVAL